MILLLEGHLKGVLKVGLLRPIGYTSLYAGMMVKSLELAPNSLKKPAKKLTMNVDSIIGILNEYRKNMEILSASESFTFNDNSCRETAINETIKVYNKVALLLNESYADELSPRFNVFEIIINVHEIVCAVFINNYTEPELKDMITKMIVFNKRSPRNETDH